MNTDENGFVLCPKCHCPTEYFEYFDEELQGKTYIVHWNIKCPNCHKSLTIKEIYTLTNIEEE